MRVLVTGGTGCLGTALCYVLREDCEVFSLANKSRILLEGVEPIVGDITDKEEIKAIIKRLKPDVVINAAAMTNVDYCGENKELAFAVNTHAAKALAAECRESDVKLIHISTDGVFNGTRGDYKEDDFANPVNVYGKSKLIAEEWVMMTNPKALIIRTALFGHRFSDGRGFVNHIIDELGKGHRVTAFTSLYGTPLHVITLSKLILQAIIKDLQGIYHFASTDKVSKAEFANMVCDVFELNKQMIKERTHKRNDTYAERPRDPSLNISKATDAMGNLFPTVEEGLKEMRDIKEDFLKAVRVESLEYE